MRICSHFTDKKWLKLRPRLGQNQNDEKAWHEAINVLKCRLEERFFRPIKILLSADENPGQNPAEKSKHPESVAPGFSVMALCCLLVETLQGFHDGRNPDGGPPNVTRCTYPEGRCVLSPSTAAAFRSFLSQRPHLKGDFNKKKAGDFSQNVRNALLHYAETRRGWLIRRNKPDGKHGILGREANAFVVYRTKFYEALYEEFKNYLRRLANPSETELRKHFLTRMDYIAKTAPKAE